MRFCIQQIPFGRCRFHDFVFAKIQRLADGASIAARGDGVGDLSGAELQRAVRSFDIGLGADLKHRAFKWDIRVCGGFDHAEFGFRFRYASEGRAGLFHGDLAHDRRIGALHHNGLAVFANAKGDGGCVEQVSNARLHLMQGVIAIQQRLGQHQRAIGGRFKDSDIGGSGIQLALYNPNAICVLDPELNAGRGDDIAGLSVHFDDLQLTLERLVFQRVGIDLLVNVDGHVDWVDDLMAVDTLGFGDGVRSVQQHIRDGMTRNIGGQRIHDLAIRLACDCEFDARKGSCLLVAAISELGVLDDADPAAYDRVLDRYRLLHDLHRLSGVLYDHWELGLIERITGRRRFFTHHIAAKRELGTQHSIIYSR